MIKMKPSYILPLLCISIVALAIYLTSETAHAQSKADILVISGTITNDQGDPVKEVALDFFLEGRKIDMEREVITSPTGRYEAEIRVLPSSPPGAALALKASKPSYKGSGRLKFQHIVQESIDSEGNQRFLAHHNFVLKRALTPAFSIATLILIAVLRSSPSNGFIERWRLSCALP
jgi:hypothetical protein